jgi:phosphoenolpyruvate mutase
MNRLGFLPRFRRAYRSLGELAAREAWLREEIEAWQLRRLNEVWAHAVAHVPHYRRLAAEARLPPRFASLTEYTARVPVLAKAAVAGRAAEFLSEEPACGSWKRTGGSTGAPMDVYWGCEAHLESLRAKYCFLASWDLDIFDRQAYLWGHSASFKPGLAGRLARWRQPLEDWLRHRLRLSAYHLGRDDLRRYLDRIAAFGPRSVYGYSRAVALLAGEAEAARFRCDTLRVAILTGEPATPPLVETIERGLGVQAAVEYGSIECGFLAASDRGRRLRVREDLVLLESVPREDERFDIVVTVLNNPSFPLLRYALGDVTDRPLERPDRGFAVLANVAGRSNDLVLSQTGRRLHSARFDALFKYEAEAVRRFRVRQHADGALTVHLEVDDPKRPVNAPALESKIRELVEGYPVQVAVVQTLPQTAAGKHRLVVSDLDLGAGPPPALGIQPDKRNGNGHAAAADNVCVGARKAEPVAEEAKATRLKRLLQAPGLSFFLEAHNALSARVVEEAGFEAVWASGLSISAALGVRDSNEASWTQVLEVVEFMSDATRIPILVDGDTGYGNFNNARRLVRKLEQRGVAGVCIEDKVFPKTNSFLKGPGQDLVDIDEFCGKIRACKDAQRVEDFAVVARIEAFIAGCGLEEALRRGEAYRRAGADAVLIHSARRTAHEVVRFKEEWGDRLPVVIVPTKYYTTPTDVFRKHGFAAVIWANHLMRTCIVAMQKTAREIRDRQSLVSIEEQVAPLAEVFRLQDVAELDQANDRYLPGPEAGGEPENGPVRQCLPGGTGK